MRLPRSDWVLIVAAAALLTLAYPPFSIVVAPFVCLVPAALLILAGTRDGCPLRRHLHQGFWYGAMTHGVLLYWLAAALWAYGHGVVALFPVVAVMFGGATAVVFVVVGRIVRTSPGRLVLALPAGVVFLEWLAAQMGPIGFPWHRLALAATAHPVLLQAADIAGAGGLGFVLATVNAALALAWWTRRTPAVAAAHLEVAAVVVFVAVFYGSYRLDAVALAPGPWVAVVQPNVGATDKWTARGRDGIVERTARLAEEAVGEAAPKMLVWPETALPGDVRSHPNWTARLRQLARRSGSTVLTGGVDLERRPGGAPLSYNAAFAFAPGGAPDAPVVHRKRKLIPMIERVPAHTLDLSRTGFGGFSPGRTSRVSDSPAGRYGVLLCYELTFEEMARDLRRSGADLIVTLSNDAWFGRTSEPYQHFAHAALRAVENRVTVVRAANTGVSGIVDPLGRVVTRTEPFEEAWVVGQTLRASAAPLATRLGGVVGPLALGLLVLLSLATPLGSPTSAHRGCRRDGTSSGENGAPKNRSA